MSPASLDTVIVLRRLAVIDQATSHLKTHRGVSADALARDIDRQWAVLHGLQIAIQGVLDVATHIATALGDDVPDYASAIDALGVHAVIDPTFARRLRAIAGFRNVIVHDYLRVDLHVVAQVLADGLSDLDAFTAAVRAWLRG